MSISTAAANAVLAAIKSALDGGFLFVFSGPVPSTPDAALDMASQHTQLAKISLAGGATGLSFAAPAAGVLSKTSAEDWSGLIAFDGAQASETTLDPTFYRFCPSGDDGRGAATGVRLQGTVGGPTSGAALTFDSATWAPDGSSTKGVGLFTVTADQS